MTLDGSCHCGALAWRFDGMPPSATACNCSICRRYGALWIYGWDDGTVVTAGASKIYRRGPSIDFHFCPACGCLGWYRGREPHPDGRTRLAANIRLVNDPGLVTALPIRHFDGLDKFVALPGDDRRVADMWF